MVIVHDDDAVTVSVAAALETVAVTTTTVALLGAVFVVVVITSHILRRPERFTTKHYFDVNKNSSISLVNLSVIVRAFMRASLPHK